MFASADTNTLTLLGSTVHTGGSRSVNTGDLFVR